MKTHAVALIGGDGIELPRDPDAVRLVGSTRRRGSLTPDLGGGDTPSSVTQALIRHMADADG